MDRYRHLPVQTDAANLVQQREVLRQVALRAQQAQLVPLPWETQEFGIAPRYAKPGTGYYEPAGWSP